MIEFDINPGINELPNLGIHMQELNPFVFQQLKKDCTDGVESVEKNIKNRSGDLLEMFHQDLPKEFFFQQPTKSKDNLEKEVLTICKNMVNVYPEFAEKLNQFEADKDITDFDFSIERFWINYQRPGEFIPLHRHSGIFSFAVWVNLPEFKTKNLEVEQWNLSKGYQGQFEFVYTDILGQIKTVRLAQDKTWEGKICVFPAELHHQVYPHYADEYRITVSGNIRIKI